jgi:hypothetical protein
MSIWRGLGRGAGPLVDAICQKSTRAKWWSSAKRCAKRESTAGRFPPGSENDSRFGRLWSHLVPGPAQRRIRAGFRFAGCSGSEPDLQLIGGLTCCDGFVSGGRISPFPFSLMTGLAADFLNISRLRSSPSDAKRSGKRKLFLLVRQGGDPNEGSRQKCKMMFPRSGRCPTTNFNFRTHLAAG